MGCERNDSPEERNKCPLSDINDINQYLPPNTLENGQNLVNRMDLVRDTLKQENIDAAIGIALRNPDDFFGLQKYNQLFEFVRKNWNTLNDDQKSQLYDAAEQYMANEGFTMSARVFNHKGPRIEATDKGFKLYKEYTNPQTGESAREITPGTGNETQKELDTQSNIKLGLKYAKENPEDFFSFKVYNKLFKSIQENWNQLSTSEKLQFDRAAIKYLESLGYTKTTRTDFRKPDIKTDGNDFIFEGHLFTSSNGKRLEGGIIRIKAGSREDNLRIKHLQN